MRCPNCQAENSTGAKFCKACGKPLPAAPTAEEGNPCPRCRVPNAREARFCRACGTTLTSTGDLDATLMTPRAGQGDATVVALRTGTPALSAKALESDETRVTPPSSAIDVEATRLTPRSSGMEETLLTPGPVSSANDGDATLLTPREDRRRLSSTSIPPDARVDEDATVLTPRTVPSPQASVPPAARPPMDTTSAPVAAPATAVTRNASGKPVWLGMAIGAVLAVLLGGGAAWYIGGARSPSETQTTTTTSTVMALSTTTTVSTTEAPTTTTSTSSEPSTSTTTSASTTSTAATTSTTLLPTKPGGRTDAGGGEREKAGRRDPAAKREKPARSDSGGTSTPVIIETIIPAPSRAPEVPALPAWQQELKAALDYCAPKSGFSKTLCIDKARNKHCQGHWNAIKECETFLMEGQGLNP